MRKKLAAGLLVAAVLIFLTRSFWLTGIGAYLVQEQPPQKSDMALVLAGDFRGGRILKAAELAKAGFVRKVLVSGPDGAYGAHECDLAIPFAVNAGYAEEMFLHFEHPARSTQEEAEDVSVELRRLGAHKVLLVTSNFHTRRAARIFRAVAPDLEFTVVGSDDPFFSPDGWWKNREGQKTALYEWMKTVAAWVHL